MGGAAGREREGENNREKSLNQLARNLIASGVFIKLMVSIFSLGRECFFPCSRPMLIVCFRGKETFSKI